MNICIALSILCVAVGICLFFNINRQALQELLRHLLHREKRGKNLRQMTQKKKKKRIWSVIESTALMLKTMGYLNGIYLVLFCSLAFAGAGILWGVTLDNTLLAPVFAIALAILPFAYVKWQYLSYKQLMFACLESSLSIVTSSYERTENIVQAFEENIDAVSEPVKTVFEEFLFAVGHLGQSVEDALEDMKRKIHFPIFGEWIDSLKNCAHDRGMKATLRPTVNKFTDINIASQDARTILFEVRNEFWLVLLLSGVFLAVTYLFLPGVFKMNLSGILPDFLFALNIVLILYTAYKAIFLTQDIKLDE